MNCLYCYKKSDEDFHPGCSKKIFSTSEPPQVPYTEDDLLKLAERMIKGKATVTGVQPKLSLHIEKPNNQPEKLTIVNLWGDYILKPQSPMWSELPQIEDLTMHLAQMEDMCQLLGRLTEDKYKSSYEKIAKEIKLRSVNPGLDLLRFYEVVLFSFLTGNADMHLKNFSLIRNIKGSYEFCPAYDLVSSALVVEGDDEELALTLVGKRRRFQKSDFQNAMSASGIPDKAGENSLSKFSNFLSNWIELVDISFLSEEMKDAYKKLLIDRHNQLYGTL
jgi:serine/threonine-protein kinase HipA